MLLINLLDWRKQLRRRRIIMLAACLSGYLFVVLLVIALLLFYLNQPNQYDFNTLEQLTRFQTNLQLHLDKLTQQQAIYQVYHDGNKQRLVNVFNQLVELLPQSIWLHHLVINQNNMTVQGYATDYRTLIEFEQIINDYHLVNAPRIQNIHYQSASRVYTFNFSAEL